MPAGIAPAPHTCASHPVPPYGWTRAVLHRQLTCWWQELFSGKDAFFWLNVLDLRFSPIGTERGCSPQWKCLWVVLLQDFKALTIQTSSWLISCIMLLSCHLCKLGYEYTHTGACRNGVSRFSPCAVDVGSSESHHISVSNETLNVLYMFFLCWYSYKGGQVLALCTWLHHVWCLCRERRSVFRVLWLAYNPESISRNWGWQVWDLKRENPLSTAFALPPWLTCHMAFLA